MDQQLTVKIDAKGRICIPAEIKEVLGDIATIKKTPEGILLIPGKRENFLEEFKKLITSEPELKGKPKFATPEEMKSVWRTAKWRLA
jgi:bifunctional DNA-binding transcriptional regulator/antitoxin component of YhaV-PrlF toxin-antitoxin module